MNDRAIYANANALDLPIGDKSVHMIATSPPYWGLRSYDTGDQKHAELGAEPLHDCLAWARGDEPCGGCYVCNMRTWAREMYRVLRDDGVLFINLGDSYANGNKSNPGEHHGLAAAKERYDGVKRNPHNDSRMNGSVKGAGTATPIPPGLKPKDLTGIPWRVALALQADGWYLRSDIIWAKPNPMPESVTDRPTKSHEYVFLLTKSARYYWDAEAVREGFADERMGNPNGGGQYTIGSGRNDGGALKTGIWNTDGSHTGRNIRTVWTIATAPYSGAHYATWPPALVERMVKAGSKPGDIVLDPFCGSGTTLMVARQLGRIGLGFDLSLKYLEQNAAVRLGHDKLAAWGNGIKDTTDYSDMPMFAGVML